MRSNRAVYSSHSGRMEIFSLRMITGGKQVTMNFISLEGKEWEEYMYEPRDVLENHSAMKNIRKQHREAFLDYD